MPSFPIGAQEVVAHLFAPTSGPHAHAAERRVREIWARCRTRLGTTEPVDAAWPHEDPAAWSDAAGRPDPSGRLSTLARNADDTVQIVLRHEHEVACLSLLAAARLGETWLSLDRRVRDVLGSDHRELLGSTLHYLGQTAAPVWSHPDAIPALGESLRLLLPEAEQGDRWWYSGGGFGELAAWEITPAEDDRAQRRFAILAGPEGAPELSAFTWSDGGGVALPAFARYLMHIARLRYQVRVRSQLPDIAELGRHMSVTRLTEAMQDLTVMRRTVLIAADNAAAALRGLVGDPRRTRPFQDDFRLAEWFGQLIDDDLAYFDAYYQGALRAQHAGSGALDTPRAPEALDRAATASPPRDDAAVRRRARILALADEWFPSRGGISAVNRRLCIAMAGEGADVFCVVPAASAAETEDAAARGVHLLAASQVPGMSDRESLMRRPALPGTDAPDAVIGHSRITGPAAEVLVSDHFPAAVRVHVVHMEPDQIEWHKTDRADDAGERAQERSELELRLAAGAGLAVPVGPRLDQWLRRDLPLYGAERSPHRMDPGFDLLDGAPAAAEPDGLRAVRSVPEGVPQILVMGRMEDAPVKGLDIAGRAVGRAVRLATGRPRWELLVRGAARGESERLRHDVMGWIGHSAVDVTVHPFDPNAARIGRDLSRASLVLLPSRADGFGLVGLEAVAVGAPTLVSERSGLGMLLRELLGDRADPYVLPVTTEDGGEATELWAHRIAAELGDREASFARAAELRALLARRRTWAAAAALLLAAVRRVGGGVGADVEGDAGNESSVEAGVGAAAS
ncbi:glycosyltransferase family 4 protein [Actinospica durhamensis]|uniref:Glycosyltransferase family 4 protein n=1 Tax=Actinospica durhamensis TaxID=1508375 RepID=A0A941ES91_9ACTN|nr:CATRA conflict system CASPASE/TPR repeat-associated protein [Actinospica durhamensis]MBR7837107.1 glycosyltransferase family 4 protein [Actinospica durhamensis]